MPASWANMKAFDLLSQTLEEEKETDRNLTHLAENRVNVKAAMSNENPGTSK